MPTRLAVLASGRGSNLKAIFEAIERGDLAAEVVLVVSNNSGAGALELASERGASIRHISSRTHDDPGAAMLDACAAAEIDGIILAGYAKRLSDAVIAAYAGRVLNIHPGPLPEFGGQGMWGRRVHEAVLAAGVPNSGPTVHVVSGDYDTGPVLAHRVVPVKADDDADRLAARVLAAEHDLYWRVIQRHFSGDRSDDSSGPPPG